METFPFSIKYSEFYTVRQRFGKPFSESRRFEQFRPSGIVQIFHIKSTPAEISAGVLINYVLSFTSMGVSIGFRNRVTNRWHFTRKA